MCVCVCVCVCVCDHYFVWLALFLCTLMRHLGFMGMFMLSWIFFSRIIWTPAVLSVLYTCFFVFVISASVHHNLACFTWKGALEIRSLLLYYFIKRIQFFKETTSLVKKVRR